ncbi:MAG: SH3 domain-containing protein, partial [Peptoniphilus harei]|nr:SH3 domain-containing protein [Peptoniphilus harei]
KSDRTNEVSTKKPKKFSARIIFFSIVLIIILSIISIFIINFVKVSRNENKIEDARGLALSGEYRSALDLYKEATKEKTSPEISNEMEKLKKLVQSDEFYQSGLEFYKNENYIDSAYNFKKVVQEDEKNYKAAQDKLLSIDNIILTQVKNAYKENKVNEAMLLLNSYLGVVPESAKATSLKKEMESKNAIDLSKNKNQKENFEKENDYTDAAQTAKKSSELLHTYRNVATEKANLRKEASVDSEIIKILEKGTELYVLETKIEQGERIWCHVEVKNTISGENMRGWISDKTLN